MTLQCKSKYGFDQYALYKKGDKGQNKETEMWYQADFPIITVTAAHSGAYQCYSFSSSAPYLWSAPSDPLELVVRGEGLQTRPFSLCLCRSWCRFPGSAGRGVGWGGEP